MGNQKMDLYNLIDASGTPVNAGSLIDPTTGAMLVKPVDTAVPVYNPSGSTITKGALVYISGYSAANGCPAITLADATAITKHAQLVVLSDILTHTTGYANGIAEVAGAYNTSARTVGDIAYQSVTTPGGIQWAAPVLFGQYTQPVGVVTSVGAVGDIYFYPSISQATRGFRAAQLVFAFSQAAFTSTKDIVAGIPLGYIGSIVGVYAIYTVASTGSLGVGTLDFILSAAGQVQSTGPATVTLTLSHTAAVGTVVTQSAAPTLQNTFVAADTLKIHYTQTTAFTSDTGVISVYVITN